MIVITLLAAGCVSHYYKIDAERVNLYLRVPGAKTVYFSTSLDQFAPYPAKKLEAGMWEVTVPADREFTYFYNVDGIIYLPECRLKQKDDFGAENCVYVPDK
jgi:hypothetical protein